MSWYNRNCFFTPEETSCFQLPTSNFLIMTILIISATTFEIEPLKKWLDQNFGRRGKSYLKDKIEIQLLTTGVGAMLTAYQLGRFFMQNKPDLSINAGVAGAFSADLNIGDVVHVIADRFADLGVEEADGSFTDVHQMGLMAGNELPFQNGVLYNMAAMENDFLPKVSGITVNKVQGTETSINLIRNKYAPEVESMEGAAFFYACLNEEVKFLQIRSVSNYVEPRNKDNWNLPLAIENLNTTLIALISSLLEMESPS